LLIVFLVFFVGKNGKYEMKEVQIFGTPKCKETQKAVRFFKERNVKVHLIDLNEKKLSKGELNNILQSVKLDDLIDTESKKYKERQLAFKVYDKFEEILENPTIVLTPIVRYERKATVGNAQETWKKWQ